MQAACFLFFAGKNLALSPIASHNAKWTIRILYAVTMWQASIYAKKSHDNL